MTPRADFRVFAVLAVLVVGVGALKGLSAFEGALGGLNEPAYAAAKPKKDAKADHATADASEAQHEEPAEEAGEDHASADEPAATPKAERCAAPGLAGRAGLSASEIRVLQTLTERRREIEAREADLETRAALLEAAEAKLEARVEELKTLKGEVEDLLGQLDDVEAAQIASLVSLYEKMKPKDAASVFVALDEEILVAIAAKMKEATLAPILAAMPQADAAALTVALAQRHRPPAELEDAIAAAGP